MGARTRSEDLKKQLEHLIRESGMDNEAVKRVLIEIVRQLTILHLASKRE